MKRVLFLCVHNAGRSQMAEAFFNQLAGGRALSANSAGTQPMLRVHPVVVEAMAEEGIELAGRLPQAMTQDMVEQADRVITMGFSIEDACPAPLLEKVEEWPLEDPVGQPLSKVREIRDQIRQRVEGLLHELMPAEEEDS